jgi:hypothetical protein
MVYRKWLILASLRQQSLATKVWPTTFAKGTMRFFDKHRNDFAKMAGATGVALLLLGCAREGFDPHRSAGAWRQTVTLVQLESKDALPQAAKSAIGVPQVSDPFCLTSQSVSTDTLESRLTDIAVLDSQWTIGAIAVTDVGVTATATGPLGTITYSGKLSPKLSDITMTMVAGNSAQGQTTTIQRTRAEHIGQCTPDMVVMGQ